MRTNTKFFTALMAGLLSCAVAHGATFTWTGAASGAQIHNWNHSSNWDGPGGAVPADATDEAVFTATVGNSSTPTLSESTAVGAVQFTAPAAAFDIGGVGLTLSLETGIDNQSSAAQTFSVSTLTLTGNQTWGNAAAGGSISATGTSLDLGANILTLDAVAGSSISIANVIGGVGSLAKSGLGTATLAGDNPNTFSGAATITGGILEAAKEGALGSVSMITVNSSSLVLAGPVGTASRVSDLAPVILNSGTIVGNDRGEAFGGLTAMGVSTIDLTSGAFGNDLTFASLLVADGNTLNVTGWEGTWEAGTSSRIFVTAEPDADSLGNIDFAGFPSGALWNSGTSELTPVPEPHEYALLFAAGLLGFALIRRYRLAQAA